MAHMVIFFSSPHPIFFTIGSRSDGGSSLHSSPSTSDFLLPRAPPPPRRPASPTAGVGGSCVAFPFFFYPRRKSDQNLNQLQSRTQEDWSRQEYINPKMKKVHQSFNHGDTQGLILCSLPLTTLGCFGPL